MSDSPPEASAPAALARRRWGLAHTAIAVLVVALGAMWIYAWFLAPEGNLDRFPDRAWAGQAEARCAAVAEEIATLPIAADFADIEPREEALRQRAAVVDQVTGLLAEQVAFFRSLEPADATSERGIAVWLADWDSYLQNRRDHAERLRAGDDVRFSVQEAAGAPVTLRMDAFAKANDMPSCIVPDDIG